MFEITIKRKVAVTRTEQGPWEKVNERPWMRSEIEDERTYYQAPEAILKATPLKALMGYASAREVTRTEETEILKQTVDELDLAAVIKAINGL